MKAKLAYIFEQNKLLQIQNEELKKALFLNNCSEENQQTIIFQIKLENSKLRDKLKELQAQNLMNKEAFDITVAEYERQIEYLKQKNRQIIEELANMDLFLKKAQILGHPLSKDRKRVEQMVENYPVQIWQFIDYCEAEYGKRKQEEQVYLMQENTVCWLMDSKENGLENQDSRVNVRSKIPYLKMDKIKETRAKLEEEKKKKEKVKSSKVVNYSNECCEKLKLSYVQAIFEIFMLRQKIQRKQKFIEQLEERNNRVINILQNTSSV